MIYEEAISYIRNIERSGSDYGIERMRILLDALGAPDKKLKFVHVAGTNGKGSVCAYLTSVLKEAGYRVGTYNSPSVFSYNERWSINGEVLDNDSVAKYMTVVRDRLRLLENSVNDDNACIIPNCDRDNRFSFHPHEVCEPTAFEIETAVAMLAFLDNKCDIVVLETGLGGRWDATNAITDKEVAVITPIGLDHCALLGNTLGEIAEEKSAIIKDTAVTCEQSDEVMQAIRHPYAIKDGKKIYYEADVKVCETPILISVGREGQKFEYGGCEYEIGMLGAHQLQNASIAICTVEALRKKSWSISQSALINGLIKARWNARLEIVKNAEQRFNIHIPNGKTLVFDGAHNPHGALALADALKTYFKNDRIHLVMGILADKDVDGVIGILAPLATRVTAVTPDSPRALKCEALKDKVQKFASCDACGDIKQAVQNALDSDCDTVVLCGSLTLFHSLND